MTGARPGVATPVRRLIARAMADTLTAFVVPDTRTARSRGLDLPAAGLRTVTTPRHASVLLIIGALPPGLASAAAIAYAQMPRPRVILTAGADAPAPAADVTVAANREALVDGIARLRDHMLLHTWSPRSTAFTAPALDVKDQDDGDMDAESDQSQDENESEHRDHDMGGHGHTSGPTHGEGHTAEPDDPSAEQQRDAGHADQQSVDDQAIAQEGHGGGGHDDMADDPTFGEGHSGMEHGGHTMDDGGFMSMIAMTQDLPRSRDGLPMEWVETAFGPLFAGLPAGLAPTLTLDGDTVATATLNAGATYRNLAASLPGPVATFPERLASLDPLAPVAYRLLAVRALNATDRSYEQDSTGHHWIGMLERERAGNHMGWLAAFGELLGVAWLAERAGEHQLALVGAEDIAAIRRLRPRIDRFLRHVGWIPLLGRRLAGIGELDRKITATAYGPVARASGIVTDARAKDPSYQALGFVPVVRDEGDALARLQVRLAEISQSLDLVVNANSLRPASPSHSSNRPGIGRATVETPRGAASLDIEVDGGYVRRALVLTPSVAHVPLLSRVAEGAELADALVGIASLDLSPWEMDQ